MSGPPVIPLAEPWLPDSCAEAVRAQIAGGFVGPGATAARFGELLAREAEVEAAVTVSSGTVALTVAAQALGLEPGDEVIIPAYGVISVINAVCVAGLVPRLADIDRRTGCLDPDRLAEAVTARTRAVCFIDFCGSLGHELDRTARFCRERGLFLIEDAAWSLGRGRPGRKGGGVGDIAATSFSVPKLVTTGQGGAVLVKSASHRDAALRAVDHGDTEWRRTNLNRGIGSNLRLSDVSAALGLAQLEHLPERLARKRAVHAVLAERLGDRLFPASDGDVPLQFIVFVRDPDAAAAALRARGILAARQYRAYHEHPPHVHLADRAFPDAAFWSAHALYLPFGIGLGEAEARAVAEATLALEQPLLSPFDAGAQR